MRFTVHQNDEGEWHWELRGSLGETVAKGAKGFKSKQLLLQSLQAMRETVPNSLVFDPLGGLILTGRDRQGPPA